MGGLNVSRLAFWFTNVAQTAWLHIDCILTLALGIGVNTAIFSVVNALLLKPLPFPELERVVAIWETGLEVERTQTTVATYLDWRAQNQSFEQLALHRSWAVNLTGIEQPERVMGFLVSPNFLAALGAQPALGRGFFFGAVTLWALATVDDIFFSLDGSTFRTLRMSDGGIRRIISKTASRSSSGIGSRAYLRLARQSSKRVFSLSNAAGIVVFIFTSSERFAKHGQSLLPPHRLWPSYIKITKLKISVSCFLLFPPHCRWKQ
jgi:hypothetical protein